MLRIKESNLLRRAIRERWPVPKAERKKVIKRLVATVHGADDARSVIAAARALIEADKLNMEQEKRDSSQSPTAPLTVHITTIVAVKPAAIEANGVASLPRPD